MKKLNTFLLVSIIFNINAIFSAQSKAQKELSKTQMAQLGLSAFANKIIYFDSPSAAEILVKRQMIEKELDQEFPQLKKELENFINTFLRTFSKLEIDQIKNMEEYVTSIMNKVNTFYKKANENFLAEKYQFDRENLIFQLKQAAAKLQKGINEDALEKMIVAFTPAVKTLGEIECKIQ